MLIFRGQKMLGRAVQDNIDVMTSPSVSAPGNVAQLALWISSETGGDLFSIQVTDPYPADWDGCLNRANKEKADDVHPALSKILDTVEKYDTIFLGYPNISAAGKRSKLTVQLL